MSDESLSIGELAARTGVGVSTLRMWEQRHGFPVPERRGSGHRRYSEDVVAAVTRVQAARAAGLRLEAAIAEAGAPAPAAATLADEPSSVWATLRRTHAEIAVHRLRKPTLLALSWAIEDEVAAYAGRAHLFGLFQTAAYYRPAARRWGDLAKGAASTHVFADSFPPGDAGGAGPVRVVVPEDSPLRREWAVVADGPGLAVALSAWEVPGQHGVPERDRVFESAWTLDPRAVRLAARVCAGAASGWGAEAAPVAALEKQTADPVGSIAANALFARVVTYVDRQARR